MNPPKVAVLGCGPSGLLAATAAYNRGIMPTVFSKVVRSRMGGAQYLHRPIPNLTPELPDSQVIYLMRGGPDMYAKKVYGSVDMEGIVSFKEFHHREQRPAWNLTELYDKLWRNWVAWIVDATIDAEWVAEHIERFDLIFSTIPLPAICAAGELHRFARQKIYIAETNVERIAPDLGDVIMYDGTPERRWYRESRLFGWEGTEWSSSAFKPGVKPPIEGLIEAYKPLSNSCNCWMNKVLRLGRYGTWTKGILTSDAYEDADYILDIWLEDNR